MPQITDTQNEINYTKENVAQFLPALIYFTDHPDFPWAKINELFNQKIAERLEIAKGETILVEATVFDIMIAAKKNNKTAIGLLLYLNRLFHDLSQLLTVAQRMMVFINIKNLLTRLDWRFYDYVGEIAILYNMLATNKYSLSRVEQKLESGKKLDFTVQELSSATVYLVEVINIHLDADKVDADPAAIKGFLTKRLTDKIADKNKMRDSPVDFTLVPVIWGAVKDLRVYSQYLQEHPLDIPNVFEPFAFLQLSDDHGQYGHRFGRLKDLFKEFDNPPKTD